MASITVAAVAAAGSIASGAISAGAAGDAASAQVAAANQATAAQQGLFAVQRAHLAPFENLGLSAAGALSYLLGLGTPPGVAPSAPTPTPAATTPTAPTPPSGAFSIPQGSPFGTFDPTGGLDPGAAAIAPFNLIAPGAFQPTPAAAPSPSPVIPNTPVPGQPFGALTAPLPAFQPFAPTIEQLRSQPGYQFTLNQGLMANTNQYAAQGLGASGAEVKGAINYAEGLAGTTFQQQFQNYLTNYLTGFNTQIAGRQFLENTLLPLVQQGQSAAAGVGSGALTTGAQIGSNIVGAGNATAAGIVGSTNAITGGFQNASNIGQTFALLNFLQNSGNPIGASSTVGT